MDWEQHAVRLADQVTDPDSRWLAPVARTARHELVPRWWEADEHGVWVLRDGAADPAAWMKAAYSDRSLVTRVGPLHADHAKPGDHPEGLPTSSATLPSLVVRMLRHGRLGDGLDLLDVGTGAGGLTAYAARRIGDRHVTSVDVDRYLTSAAAERLARMGLHPQFLAVDATATIPGTYDRIIATVALQPGPGLRTMLGALREGGRLVTTLARTSLILTGWKHANGEVVGRIERDTAGFMLTRSGEDYPPALAGLFALAREADGDETSTGRYPVLDVANAWEVRSMLEVTAPGTELDFRQDSNRRTAYLVHPDGSWARASAERFEPPTVHQGGLQRLWTVLERVRNRLNVEGGLPLYGSSARITPDGVCHLSRGKWRASMGDR
ncbi:methyltransferase domain-containing protein [Streptomyces sp. ISL-98]|uniref:methyltransferase domain-containing protein n=1 Tax=Streptomyces sp. ISL-98 TaxID=2819192 RepID=UPI001BE9DDC9|nr:methyltransferase domain-containing protein [Streptomyces sp. ISL-98]MBT2505551.1 methyltransferase domain-containing protein [Streptomyces sp. ISL-98]